MKFVVLFLSMIVLKLHRLISANYVGLTNKLLSCVNSMVCTLAQSMPLSNTSWSCHLKDIDCASKVSLSLLFYICIYCFYLGFL